MQADRLNMETNTAWDCGTPRSTHTAFTIPPKREPAELIKRARVTPHPTRAHMAATAMESPEERSARIKAANQAKRDRILRENKNQFIPETRASRDRTAAIAGKSIYLGSNP